MDEQQNIEQAVIGKHWRTIDVAWLLARHLYALQQELAREGADIPARTLLLLEGMGYTVDLSTGVVGDGS